MIKAQRNECTFYNCFQGLLDKKAAIQTQELVLNSASSSEERPFKCKRNFHLRLQKPEQALQMGLRPFQPPTNVPGLQLIDSAQVLPDDLKVVNASGRVVGATIQEFMQGLGIASTQQQHAQRMQIMAFQEQQRTLIMAMEQRILSSIAQIAAGQGQGQAVQAAFASASDTGHSSPVSTSRKRTRSDAPHLGTFRLSSCISPTEYK
ncbi:hypothetical protein BC939DRAFT_440601 [Gamsiella multidivaricata]|uniref:uncharacterized protein n=1 Tax=Gamsiella multidivaricata TaxID=101098 RepID=UPI0022209F85|nr:uncharacterized protein BC939DRAFT_440601 [Gamsiella multidivaricata]KAI7829793.1 hypothetical protein BC939DRAFT_440601 [Gamsiella multidivaricata]